MKAWLIRGCCVAVTLAVSAPAAGQYTYTEDFATTVYKDTLNTTAVWDTVSGVLKLAPFALTMVGNYDTPNVAWDVAVSGNYAYVADGSSGLQVIDISDPTSPSFAGTYYTPGGAVGVAISGDYAFVADQNAGLQVIDISDPTTPSLAGSYDTPGNAKDVAISGDYAFVADYSAGLVVIDISDPTTPSLAGSYDTPGNSFDVAVSGDFACVADQFSGLRVIDISDPTNPSPVGSYAAGTAYGVAISGDYVYVADYTLGLLVIDIGYLTTPSLVGSYATSDHAWDVTLSGDFAYVADGSSGLQVIDISDATSPSLAGSYDTPQNALGGAVAGEYAYVADHTSGLQVIDICDFKSPSLVGSYVVSGYFREVDVSGDYAYMADQGAGLWVMDVSDPTGPTYAGGYFPGDSWDVDVAGNHAYLADGMNGLVVIDILYPTSPSLAGSYNTPDGAHGVAVSGNLAFVADELTGLLVIDISDPTSPTLTGSYDTPGFAADVAVAGDYACVADGTIGLQVIDVSNPAAPLFLGSYDTPGDCKRVTLDGDYVYVADAGSGLQVIDISSPTSPALVGSYDTPGSGYTIDVAIAGDYACVTDGLGGLLVFDISDPTNPTIVGSDQSADYANGLTIAGDYAYVADTQAGLKVSWVFQRFVDATRNTGQSVQVNSSIHDIGFVKLSSTQTNSVQWEVSANGGTDWQGVSPDASVEILTVTGSDLRWRSTHEYSQPFMNPICSDVVIDWLSTLPIIDTITDIPNDQGRQVSISWTPSGHDHLGSPTPIVEYAIYRKIDDGLSTLPNSRGSGKDGNDTPTRGDGPIPPLAYPPGDWHFLMTVPAYCEDAYAAVVPTLADSTVAEGMYYTTFFVSALTASPGVYFDSPPDSGYSLDNLDPVVPSSFVVAHNAGVGNELSWDECPDGDFACFRVYRSETEDFDPSPGDLVHTTAATDWLDTVEDGWKYHYKITAVDGAGNESAPASPESAAGAELSEVPDTYTLYQNVPNPFNPTTTIRFDLPVRSHVKLIVYDVKGQLVRVLLDRDVGAGSKEIAWDGRDSGGHGVASGIYFYRLDTPGFSEARKMILLR
jgi:hypothetical protein